MKQSFAHAFSGLFQAIRRERNLRIHLVCALVVIALGLLLQIGPIEWGLLLLTIGCVISAELFNSALEAVVDLASPEFHALAKTSKDIAAAAVLVLALFSVSIGLLILGPPLWELVFDR